MSLPGVATIPFPLAFFKSNTPTPPPTSPHTFVFSSNGDTKGVLYFIGRDEGVSPWTNPHTATFVTAIQSSDPGGTDGIQAIVDRAISYVTTNNGGGDWFAIDLGASRTLVVTDYSLQNGSNAPGSFLNAPKNWKLQGSNDVATNDVIGVNAATWVDVDTRTNDTSIAQSSGAWSHFVLGSTPSAYRFLRILSTGVNQFGLNYLQIGEWEFYGDLTF